MGKVSCVVRLHAESPDGHPEDGGWERAGRKRERRMEEGGEGPAICSTVS